MPYCPTHDYEWTWGEPPCPRCLAGENAENAEAAESVRFSRREILISISGLITAVITRKPSRGKANG